MAERFGLKIHREPKLLSGFALRLGKAAPVMTSSAALAPDAPPQLPASQVRLALDKDGFMVFPPGYANMMARRNDDGISRLTAGRQSMKNLADYLSRLLQQPVVDETGLDGLFDFHLTYATLNALITGDAPPTGNVASDPAPTLVQAIEQQLGLKMEARKLPVEIIVIDHIERTPIEN
jgi:uncharacterized protein (TIGR03435 family)